MLVTVAGMSSVVRMWIMGGGEIRETMAGANSLVVAMITCGGRLTPGIIVEEPLVGYEVLTV